MAATPANDDPSTGPDPFDPLSEDLSIVPLFPLPNVVLFPRAVLPLHIFEDRYKAMTRHALEGDRRVAMALLRPGWEKSYYGRPAIEPVVCVGTILTHEQLPDGNYNLLLQGEMRARVVGEVGNEPYRLARVEALREVPASPADFQGQARRLRDLFTHPFLTTSGLGLQFAKLLATPLPIADVADLAAYTFLEDADLKQSLLAEPDVSMRIARTIEALKGGCLVESSTPPTVSVSQAPAALPARFRNPSLN